MDLSTVQPEFSHLQPDNLMNEIKAYLEQQSPDFIQGFALFCKYSRNQSLMSFIGRKKDMVMLRYNLQKLSEMGDIRPNPNATIHEVRFNKFLTSANTQEENEKVKIVDERRVKREDLPEELVVVYDSIVNDYKLMRSIHEKMKNANSDSGRKEFRDQLTAIELQVKSKWAQIDGQLINGKKTDDNSGNSFNVNTARAYISKMLKKEVLTDEQRSMVKQKVEELISAGAVLKEETLLKLKEKGF